MGHAARLGRTARTAATSAGYAGGDAQRAGGVKVVGHRATGWTLPTGTEQRSGYTTYTAPDISSTYDESEVQAIADGLQAVSRTLMALLTDLEGGAGHGLIGPTPA